MTRICRTSLTVLAGTTWLLGCGDNQDDAGARALLAEVKEQDYRSWARAPGWEQRRHTSAPHGEQVDIYINEVIEEALASDDSIGVWPQDSIIVKDGWDGSELELIAIMEKRSDGWYWAEYDEDGDPDFSGYPSTCIDCHGSGSDFVRAFALP